ncbi:hypothetical protein ACFQE5_12755 [Pseudonocardia hispaniensis]|uniref:DUF559 domain-containing protein n=1 Tax=Pseudonocardia hispaniensis TaxID=904933 RepID=A0ABW1J2R5_9PSEU
MEPGCNRRSTTLWITARNRDSEAGAAPIVHRRSTRSGFLVHGAPVDMSSFPAFRGSEAVAAGLLTAGQLRGPRFRPLFRNVYTTADRNVTHELRCRAATLALPDGAVITGRSAATVRGVRLCWPDDDVQVVAPLGMRLARRTGLRIRRTELTGGEWDDWANGRLASPLRTALDLLLARPLPDAVADLDAVLRADLVGRRRSVKIARTDLAFPAEKVAVEYDGDWRDGELWALNRDRDRLNRVHNAGWAVVFITAPLLRNKEQLLAAVRSALARRR